MNKIESIILENFPNLKSVHMLDSNVRFISLKDLMSEKATNWLKWLDQSCFQFTDLTIKLTDNSQLFVKPIGQNHNLIIHNEQENNALLVKFIEDLIAEEIVSNQNPESHLPKEESSEKGDLKLLDAVRIQKLILPKKDEIAKEFRNFFVVHEQQDVVGGDFYWYSRKGNNTLLAIIDCTGHSVEGAMTSMVCNSLLNQSIFDFDPQNVDRVLINFYDQLNKYNQTSSDDYGIGAEIGLFCFNHESKVITFCTTGISAFIKREDGIEHLKSKKVITYENIEKSIAKTSFSMKNVTGIYGFTDGLSDQFDAADKKKLGSKGILKMIEDEQDFDARYYLSEIKKWKGDNMQYDDITLIGIAI